MFFSDNIRHPKWTEWCNKSEEESTQIAEQNEWLWYFDWFDVGDILRYHYEKADTSPNVLAIQLAEKYLPTDDYDLHKFAEKLHEDIKITHEININGSLWGNSAKYEYVDKIVVGYDDIGIYWKGKMIGSIARENLQTMLEQNYEENTTIDLIEELVHSFDMKKVGDL